MKKDPTERIAVRHPDMPGEFVVISKRSFPSRAKRGWVEAKSPAAKAAVETQSPRGDAPNPSVKEDKKS